MNEQTSMASLSSEGILFPVCCFLCCASLHIGVFLNFCFEPKNNSRQEDLQRSNSLFKPHGTVKMQEPTSNENEYVSMTESQASSTAGNSTSSEPTPVPIVPLEENFLTSQLSPPSTAASPSPTNISNSYIAGLTRGTSAEAAPNNDPYMENGGAMQITAEALTATEIQQLRLLLLRTNGGDLQSILSSPSMDSDYSAFKESTHAWAVFADNPQKRAGPWERLVGTTIIVFQLFAYRLFAAEAIEDFQAGQVPLMVSHKDCLEMEEEPYENFQCEAEFTNAMDAFVAFIMLGIFLAGDMLQAGRAIRDSKWGTPMMFALIAGVEVLCAFLAASVAVSYHLFIGEVTDAVEVGVGLLFIRELSQQTYHGIGSGKIKQFKNFFLMVTALVSIGMVLDPLSAKIFAGYVQ